MPKLTKFTIGPSGELVYKSTGKLAPEGYTFRKNTVYGKNGRRVGTLSRNLTKTQAERIARAEQSRQRRTGRAAREKPTQGKPRKPSKKVKSSQKYGEDWDEFEDTEFPQPEEAVIEEFAQRVRDCALSVAPPALQKKIQALTSAAIWKAYQEDQYIFEIYFQYHQPSDEPHKSDVSVWLYQMVKRIEQYGCERMIWGLDTETDNDGSTAWIVQWTIVGDGGVHKGTDVRTLMHCLRRLGRTREKQFIYIHNLKYDLEFIKYAIWDLKEEYDAKIDAIFRNGQPIQVKVDVSGRELIFRDSAKKWQGNLRSLGDAIGCPKLENVDPEFKPGWSSQLHLERPEDWQYIIRDARICYLAGKFWHEGGFRSATTSGDAWKDMRRVKGTKFWEEQFPALTYEEDEALRDGYFGGINISRRRGSHFRGAITHDDKISMYPGVMLHKALPVGKPVYMGSMHPDAGLWVGKLRVKLQLKPEHIPWFTFKNGIDYCGEDIEYGQHVEHCLQWHNLTLTSVDWDNLAIDYDIEVQEGPAEFWAFESRVGLMKPYIDKWGAEKKRAKKGSVEREHAKRMLNAAYGRFALIPDGTQTELVMEDGDLRWRSETVKGEPTAYLPYAMFVTAWARWDLMARVREVVRQRGIDSVLHCDTDSVIYLGDPIGGYGTEIGEWAMESRPSEIWEGGFKRYIEVVDGKLSVTCAGVPQPKDARGMPYGMQIELLDEPEKIFGGTLGHEHYRIRSEWLRKIYERYGKDPDDVNTLKLLPRRVPGGVILEGHTHCIDDDGLKIRMNRAV